MNKMTNVKFDFYVKRLAWFLAALIYTGTSSMSALASNHSNNAEFADILRMALMEQMNSTATETREYLVNWSAVSGADKYQLRYRRTEDSDWTAENPVGSTTFSLNLSQGNYELQVAACVDDSSSNNTYCGGEVSDFSGSYNLAVEGYTWEPDTPQAITIATAPTQSDSEKTTGGLNGNAMVSGSGEATWSVDLVVPAGVGGYTPGVSISYDSGASNGVLGVGWQVSAGSSIMRCRKFLEEDGQYKEVTFTNIDELCYGGSRMVLDPTDEHFDDLSEYRLKHDPSTKIVYHEASNHFVLHKPNGETWTFGNSNATRVNDIESDVAYKWLLARKQDTYNNSIAYTYTGGNSEARHINTIEYSGNTIDFQYTTSRTDGSNGYYHGNKIIDNALLNKIVISNHNDVAINSYHFEHELSAFSDRNLLKTVTRCNGNNTSGNTCLQPTTYEYEENVPFGIVPASQEIVIDLDDYFDTYGDEKSNYCDGPFQYPPTYCASKALELGDTDGNGIPEIIVLAGHDETYQYRNFIVDLGLTGGFVAGSHNATGDMFRETVSLGGGAVYPFYGAGLSVRDMNGDGIDEIYVDRQFQGSAHNPVWADINGDGLPDEANMLSSVAENHAEDNNAHEGSLTCEQSSYHDYEVDGRVASTLDFNGDGLMDRLYSTTGICEDSDGSRGNLGDPVYYILKNTSVGDTFSEEVEILDDFEIHTTTKFGDFNGDGYQDSTHNGCMTGEGLDDCIAENNLSGVGFGNLASVTDINADGRDDILFLEDSKIKADLSKIKDRSTGNPLLDLGDYEYTDLPQESATVFWADLDGDGLPAFIYFDKGTQKIHIRPDNNTDNKSVDALLSVDNGMGQTSNFEYDLMVNGEVYQRTTDVDTSDWGSPVFDSKGAGFKVQRFTQNVGEDLSGNDLTAIQEYRYEGLRNQAGGRGSLGFEKVIVTDVVNQERTTTEYRQQYPYNGQLKRQTIESLISESESVILSDNIITEWHEHTYFGGEIIEVSAKTSVTCRYTADGSAGTVSALSSQGASGSTTCDAEGVTHLSTATSTSTINTGNGYPTLTQNVVTTVDEIDGKTLTETTDFKYEDEDTANWRISRVTSSEKTSTLTKGSQALGSSVQKSAQSYNNNGKVATKTVGEAPVENEGNDATIAASNKVKTSQYLLTDIDYDAYGNAVQTTQCSSHFANVCGNNTVPDNVGDGLFHVYDRKIIDYDDTGRYVDSESNALFTVATYSDYNALGQAGKVTDANGIIQNTYFDAFGRVYFNSSNNGSSSRTKIGICDISDGCPSHAFSFAKVVRAGKPTSITYFDVTGSEVGKHVQSIGGKWIETISVYNAKGQLIGQSVPHYSDATSYNSASFEYDVLGRKWREVAADGTTKVTSWSGTTETQTITTSYSGQYTSATVNQTNSSVMNGFGQRKTSTDSNSLNTSYSYNELGLLTQTTNVDNTIVNIGYDNYGRKTSLEDSDKGDISYLNNAQGTTVQRVSPTDDKENSYFDAAGRLIKKETESTAGDVIGEFLYDNQLLDYEVGSEGIRRDYHYETVTSSDNSTFTRLSGVTHQFDPVETPDPDDATASPTITYSKSWDSSIVYDHIGRIFQEFDTSGNSRGVQYSYKNGYMEKLSEARDSEIIYYQANSMDAWGNVTSWTLENGHTGEAQFDSNTGFMSSLEGKNASNVLMQDHVYEYDGLGNLRARVDKTGGLDQDELVETYEYDNLNRLTEVNFRGQKQVDENNPDANTLSLSYYDNGSIKSKSDVSTSDYQYGGTSSVCGSIQAGVHAVSSIGNRTFCYDAKGNQTSTHIGSNEQRTITYTGYDKPSSITSTVNNASSHFSYDTNHKRFKRVDTEGDSSKTTYYVGNNEIVIHDDSGLVETKRYIGNNTIDIVRSNGAHQTTYLHKDHIGSISVIADANGGLIQRLSHDAFGKRREAASWNAIQNVFANPTIKNTLDITHRGFTGHEHVDHADIIHMGGRIYDPVIGRFVQADPIIQAPDNSQSFNRYSYVFNNPLSYTDPTGYTAEVGDARGGSKRVVEDEAENGKEKTAGEERAAFKKMVRKITKKLGLSTAQSMRSVKKSMENYDAAEAGEGAFSSSGETGGGAIKQDFEVNTQRALAPIQPVNSAASAIQQTGASENKEQALNDTPPRNSSAGKSSRRNSDNETTTIYGEATISSVGEGLGVARFDAVLKYDVYDNEHNYMGEKEISLSATIVGMDVGALPFSTSSFKFTMDGPSLRNRSPYHAFNDQLILMDGFTASFGIGFSFGDLQIGDFVGNEVVVPVSGIDAGWFGGRGTTTVTDTKFKPTYWPRK